MSHHGREYERDDEPRTVAPRDYTDAIRFIEDLAAKVPVVGWADAAELADTWLDQHGRECRRTRAERHVRRLGQIDAELAKLEKERAELAAALKSAR